MYVLGEVGGGLLVIWRFMDARRAHADALRYQGVAFECVAIKTVALCCVVAICIHMKD